jgi:hypothetical protein
MASNERIPIELGFDVMRKHRVGGMKEMSGGGQGDFLFGATGQLTSVSHKTQWANEYWRLKRLGWFTPPGWLVGLWLL